MSTNPSPLNETIQEGISIGQLEGVLFALRSLANGRLSKNRQARRERYLQLVSIAEQRVQQLGTVPARKRPKAVADTAPIATATQPD